MVPKERKGDILSNFGDQKQELKDQTNKRSIIQCLGSSYPKVGKLSKWTTKPNRSSKTMNQNISIMQI